MSRDLIGGLLKFIIDIQRVIAKFGYRHVASIVDEGEGKEEGEAESRDLESKDAYQAYHA